MSGLFETPEYLAESDATAAAFADPTVGDYFHEMCSFHVFVVAVEPDGRVAVITGNQGTMPRDGELRVFETHDAYRKHFSYGSIPGYWVRVGKRRRNVQGWFTSWPEVPPAPEPSEPGTCPACGQPKPGEAADG